MLQTYHAADNSEEEEEEEEVNSSEHSDSDNDGGHRHQDGGGGGRHHGHNGPMPPPPPPKPASGTMQLQRFGCVIFYPLHQGLRDIHKERPQNVGDFWTPLPLSAIGTDP